MASEEVLITGVAHDGAGVGRLADGRVVFVPEALRGESVQVEVVTAAKRSARAELVAVIEAAPDRVEPPCPSVAAGCGGCDFQHASVAEQRSAKVQIVTDALQRIGRLEPPAIGVRELSSSGFRTTVRAAVLPDGRAGFRRAASHDVVVPQDCLVAHPLIQPVLLLGRFVGSTEVTIRCSPSAEAVLVIVDGDPDAVLLPGDVRAHVVSAHDPGDAHLIEHVADVAFRVSAGSFFQTRADGAAALVDEVAAVVARRWPDPPGVLVDLCAGVGLFAATVPAGRVVAVESAKASVTDARINLANLDASAKVIATPMQRWRPERADVLIADPPRDGLGSSVVQKVAATGAAQVVLVSCDAGSLGRDARLLVDAGYRLDSVTLVDLFPHTHHVEVVSSFSR